MQGNTLACCKKFLNVLAELFLVLGGYTVHDIELLVKGSIYADAAAKQITYINITKSIFG